MAVARNTNAAVEPRPSKRALDAVQQTGGWQTYRSSWACLSALTRLTELPAEIGNLTSLRSLFLGDNQLTELPPEIGDLAGLERLLRLTPKGLNLSHNLLTILPTEITQLREEWGIDLSGNPLMS